jgi:hypothetical protein
VPAEQPLLPLSVSWAVLDDQTHRPTMPCSRCSYRARLIEVRNMRLSMSRPNEGLSVLVKVARARLGWATDM